MLWNVQARGCSGITRGTMYCWKYHQTFETTDADAPFFVAHVSPWRPRKWQTGLLQMRMCNSVSRTQNLVTDVCDHERWDRAVTEDGNIASDYETGLCVMGRPDVALSVCGKSLRMCSVVENIHSVRVGEGAVTGTVLGTWLLGLSY